MATIDLVIEMGDSKTCIGERGRGLVLNEASLVAFTRNRNKMKIVAVGNKAKELQGKTESNVWVESPIKNDAIENLELAKVMLDNFLAQTIEKKNIFTKINAIFCVSCALLPEEKREIEKLAISFNFNNYWIVPSIICSAMGANLNISNINSKMLVDIGSGSTQIAVINQNNIVKGIGIELGGSVIDKAISKTVFDLFNIVISEFTAKQLKDTVGSLHKNDISTMDFFGFDALTRVTKANTVFSKDLFECNKIAYDKIAEGIEIFINQLGPDLLTDIIQSGIYLCGGGSKITGLEQYFKNIIDINFEVLEEPDTISIKGGFKLLENRKILKQIVEKN